MTCRLLHAFASGLLVLSGCNGPKEERAPENGSTTVKAVEPKQKPAPRPAVVLASDGLRLSSGTLSFGAPAEAATAALTQALGKPPTGQGANEECTGGPMTYAQWDDGFYLWFSDGKFAGWDDRGTYRTAEGLRIGSGRAEVDSLPDLSMEDSSLGTEFLSGGLGGLLSSEAPDAKVTALWGGHSCAVR